MPLKYSYSRNLRSSLAPFVGDSIANGQLIPRLVNLMRYHGIMPVALFKYNNGISTRMLFVIIMQTRHISSNLYEIFDIHRISYVVKGDNYFESGYSIDHLVTLYRAEAYKGMKPSEILSRMTPIPHDTIIHDQVDPVF